MRDAFMDQRMQETRMIDEDEWSAVDELIARADDEWGAMQAEVRDR